MSNEKTFVEKNLDLETLKKQEKCGTCCSWCEGQCFVNAFSGGTPFKTTKDSICYSAPSFWRPKRPDTESILERLREKQGDIVGVDINNIELLKLEIKKQKIYIKQLEKERDVY